MQNIDAFRSGDGPWRSDTPNATTLCCGIVRGKKTNGSTFNPPAAIPCFMRAGSLSSILHSRVWNAFCMLYPCHDTRFFIRRVNVCSRMTLLSTQHGPFDFRGILLA